VFRGGRASSVCGPCSGRTRIRSARAKLKQDLASGKLDLAGIVADPPEWAMSARVRDLLLALPRIGPVKAGRMLAQCGSARSKTLGGLTDRQRAKLIDFFRV
jgi:S13-like H2TH domain